MALKKGNYRLRIAAGGICADEVRNISVVRPVAPVQNNSLLANGNIKSPMTGKAIKVLVKLGDKVEEGDVIVIVEAMKMENQIRSECSGQVKSISVQEGESVSVDQLLAVVEVEPLQAKKNG
jgi:biotin carboxyl carrier protein